MWKKLKRWFRKKKEPKYIDSESLVIWGVIDGPFDNEDGDIWLVVKASVDGEVFATELYVEDLEQAYQIVTHFSRNIEPIQFALGDN